MSVDLLKLIKDISFRKVTKNNLFKNKNNFYWNQPGYLEKKQKENTEYLNKTTRELIEAQREKEKSNNKLIIKNEMIDSLDTNINYNFYNGILLGVIFGFGVSIIFYNNKITKFAYY